MYRLISIFATQKQAVFERQFRLEYYIQNTKHFTMY